jgi:hypothetical protein
MFDPDQYNDEVQQWGKGLPDLLRSRGSSYGIQHRENSPSNRSSLNSMRVKYKRSDGLISLVTLTVNRSLIYTHKGAGKGRGGNKGSRWIDKFGTSKKTAPDSLGKAGTGGRREKPFINDVLEGSQGVEKLADIVAENLATTIVNSAIVK